MRRLAVTAIVVGSAACSLTTNLDGLSVPIRDEAGVNDAAGTPDDGAISDGAIKDGGTSAETGPVGDGAAPASFIVNGSFEAAGPASSACGAPWDPYRAQLFKDPTSGRTGSACMVCGQTAASYTIDYGYDQSPQVTAGQKVHVRAWVKKAPAVPSSPMLSVTIAVYNNGGVEIDPGSESPRLALSDTWTALDFETTIKTTGLFNMYVGNPMPASAPDCFLIDDVAAWFVP